MGPIWGWQDPDWPHVGSINFAIWVYRHLEGQMFFLYDWPWTSPWIKPIFPWLSYSRGCVSEVVLPSYSVICCIYISGILLPFLMCSIWRVQMIGYIMTCWSCLFVFTLHSLSLIISIFHCYHVDLSQGIELLKCLSGNIYCSVFLRLSQLSQLSIIQLMGLCVFSLANSLVMIMEMCTFLLSSSEIGTIVWG